jgi:glutamine amidotransferase/cyclase
MAALVAFHWHQGFDTELVEAVSSAVSIPVIASSGAGCPAHFTQVSGTRVAVYEMYNSTTLDSRGFDIGFGMAACTSRSARVWCALWTAQVFESTKASAALAAGIFHRQEVAIKEVKQHMAENQLPTRLLA